MSTEQSALAKGALKSAVASATGMVLSLNIVDPEHFTFKTFGGWEHLLAAILISVVVAEARFWNQWANSGNGNGSNAGKSNGGSV